MATTAANTTLGSIKPATPAEPASPKTNAPIGPPLRRSEEFARDCFPEITQARFRAPASELSAHDKG